MILYLICSIGMSDNLCYDVIIRYVCNKEGADIDGVYYDPQFKGRIIFRTSEGRRFVATPDIVDNELSRKLRDLEGRGAPANAIAAMVYAHLNTKNKVQGETDSKI
jgi:hypothetical protein